MMRALRLPRRLVVPALAIANSQVRDSNTFGVIKMTLRFGAYDWQFVPVAGTTFTESGTGSCR